MNGLTIWLFGFVCGFAPLAIVGLVCMKLDIEEIEEEVRQWQQ